MENIEKELEKLICYTYGREVIGAEDVEAICCGQTVNRIFVMVDAIAKKEQKQALDLYYDLVALREPPMEDPVSDRPAVSDPDAGKNSWQRKDTTEKTIDQEAGVPGIPL